MFTDHSNVLARFIYRTEYKVFMEIIQLGFHSTTENIDFRLTIFVYLVLSILISASNKALNSNTQPLLKHNTGAVSSALQDIKNSFVCTVK